MEEHEKSFYFVVFKIKQIVLSAKCVLIYAVLYRPKGLVNSEPRSEICCYKKKNTFEIHI